MKVLRVVPTGLVLLATSVLVSATHLPFESDPLDGRAVIVQISLPEDDSADCPGCDGSMPANASGDYTCPNGDVWYLVITPEDNTDATAECEPVYYGGITGWRCEEKGACYTQRTATLLVLNLGGNGPPCSLEYRSPDIPGPWAAAPNATVIPMLCVEPCTDTDNNSGPWHWEFRRTGIAGVVMTLTYSCVCTGCPEEPK